MDRRFYRTVLKLCSLYPPSNTGNCKDEKVGKKQSPRLNVFKGEKQMESREENVERKYLRGYVTTTLIDYSTAVLGLNDAY